ncbi:SemiSWEET transporter [Rhizobium sp. S152]|uniref:SemiSWEET family sugar transporter n=1 Tax=Rhizobium sp. S152 TaxID=3055038 RepID=UPI0025A984E5|nr:SemiSWEET transporter [Rhizobium sp. S152]MDM9627738.1 SemiSWEET transporter [Rhizobium sp. S152]
MDIAVLVGYGASICSVASFVPQAAKVIRSRQTKAISAKMYILTVTGFALWTAFGVLKSELPIILTNAICFCLSALILAIKVMARRKAQER